jgi:hypothetical protein
MVAVVFVAGQAGLLCTLPVHE